MKIIKLILAILLLLGILMLMCIDDIVPSANQRKVTLSPALTFRQTPLIFDEALIPDLTHIPEHALGYVDYGVRCCKE